MRVEGKVENCIDCYFLRDGNSPQASCGRTGSFIEKTQVCLTGRLLKYPENLEQWVKLVKQAQNYGILVKFKHPEK